MLFSRWKQGRDLAARERSQLSVDHQKAGAAELGYQRHFQMLSNSIHLTDYVE